MPKAGYLLLSSKIIINMKRYLIILITFFVSNIIILAADGVQTIAMNGTPIEWDNPAEENNGRRIPPRPVMCTIDFNQRTVDGISSDILIYEVCDTEEGSVDSTFSDEEDFIEFLEGLKGEYIIQFTTCSYVYTGYLDL